MSEITFELLRYSIDAYSVLPRTIHFVECFRCQLTPSSRSPRFFDADSLEEHVRFHESLGDRSASPVDSTVKWLKLMTVTEALRRVGT